MTPLNQAPVCLFVYKDHVTQKHNGRRGYVIEANDKVCQIFWEDTNKTEMEPTANLMFADTPATPATASTAEVGPPPVTETDTTLWERNIPLWLQQQPRWGVYALQPNKKTGKLDKIPFNARTGQGEFFADGQGVTLQEAIKVWRSNPQKYAGVGYAFNENEGTGVMGADLDGCVDPETGEIASWAKEICDSFGSYVETSVSGKGLHILFIGKMPKKPNGESRQGVHIGSAEVYSGKRFFAVTGERLAEYPAEVSHNQAAADKLVARIDAHEFEKPKSPENKSTSTNDKPSTKTADVRSANLLALTKIVSDKPCIVEDERGNRSEYPSHSEADAALCCALATKYLQQGLDEENLASTIRADFEKSVLFRDEKGGSRRPEYLDRDTIPSAIEKAKKNLEPTVTISGKKPGETPVATKQTMRDRDTESPSAPAPNEFVTVSANKVETHRVRWIWPGYFAEKLNTISGDPGDGKGLLTCYLAGRVSTGTDFFNCKNTLPPSEVLMLSNEDDLDDTLVPRLMAAEADLSKVNILQMVSVDYGEGKTRGEREFQLDQDMRRLEAWLLVHPETRLVIVDPASNYLGDSIKMIDEKSVRRALMPLKKLAEKLHITVIAVMHLNKKSDLKSIYRVTGAMGFVGVGRMNWMCLKVPPDKDGNKNDDFEMQKVKGNLVKRDQKGLIYHLEEKILTIEGQPTPIPYLKFIRYADNNLDQPQPGDKPAPAHRPAVVTDACEDDLTDLLSSGPMNCDLILERMAQGGFGRAVVFRAANNLKLVRFNSDEKCTRSDGKQYPVRMWRLPDRPPEEGQGQDTELPF